MEEKYDPFHIVGHVWSKFRTLPEHREAKIEEYSIFIEIKYSKNECYLIRAGETNFLWRGAYLGTTWKPVNDPEELYKNRDLLRAVHVTFKGEPININNKILEPFPNCELFWNYITR